MYRKVITAHPSLALKVYKCKVLERFRNIEKAPSRDHSQDGAFLLWIRANISRQSRRWRNRCSSNTCLVDPKGIEPSNLTDANRALSQLSYGPMSSYRWQLIHYNIKFLFVKHKFSKSANTLRAGRCAHHAHLPPRISAPGWKKNVDNFQKL